MILKVSYFVVLLAFFNSVLAEFNLTVVHISDFHSHWFEFDENKHDCSKSESREGKCYGGFSRLLTFVRDIRKKEKNVLVLSSGEFFLGRSLHALHGWKPAHSLVPRLNLDAMSLSNHDFDSGILELSAFLYNMKFPILCANMLVKESTFLYSRVNKSAVLDVNGTKVGIVGYIHRHALKKSKSAVTVKFLPEIPALQEEVSRLESEGVDKIIALGHAGYHTDLEIAKKVKGVDIVIGGDSDIMLFDPGDDTNEFSKVGNIHGNYPRVHEHETEIDDERKIANRTLVLHIPQHGMYVGVLRATFDDNGKIIHESGEPVLLDSSIPEDEDTLEFLKYAKGALETIVQHSRLPDDAELLGKTSKLLDGNRRTCRMSECSLGNFIVDAMLHEFTFHYRNKSEHRNPYEKWGPIDALVYNSGPILRSIEPGFITIQDLLKSVFLGGTVKRVYMSGQQILDMMEHSVKHYDPSGVTAPGTFLQIAGLRVEYDLSQVPGKRVRRLAIRCRDCGDDDTYPSVKPYKTYVIGMPTFLKNGRDGFYDFEDEDEDMGQFDALLIVEYLRRMYEIEPKVDGRIKFYTPNVSSNATFGIQHLLFGDPAPASNDLENLNDVMEKEEASKVSSDEKAEDKIVNEAKSDLKNSDFDIDVETSKTGEKTSEENIQLNSTNVSETSNKTFHLTSKENETIHADISENEIQTFKKRDRKKRHIENVLESRENQISPPSAINQSDILSTKSKENSSNNKLQSNKTIATIDSNLNNLLKTVFNTTAKNFNVTLQNITQFFNGSSGIFDFLDEISRLDPNLFKKNLNVSLLESLGKNISLSSENLLRIKKYLHNIIDDTFSSKGYSNKNSRSVTISQSDIPLSKKKDNDSSNDITLDTVNNYLNVNNFLRILLTTTSKKFDFNSTIENISKVFFKSLGVFDVLNGISRVKHYLFENRNNASVFGGFEKNSSFSSENLMHIQKYLQGIIDDAFPSLNCNSKNFTNISNVDNGELNGGLKTINNENEQTKEAREQQTIKKEANISEVVSNIIRNIIGEDFTKELLSGLINFSTGINSTVPSNRN